MKAAPELGSGKSSEPFLEKIHFFRPHYQTIVLDNEVFRWRCFMRYWVSEMTGQNGILIVFPEVFLKRYLGVARIIHIDKDKNTG